MRAHDESNEKADGAAPGRARQAGEASAADRIRALQRDVGNAAVAAELVRRQRSTVHSVLSEPGTPLAEPVRQDMEARLGADLSDVRMHTGAVAQRSAQEIGARAYTSGSHVVIGPGGGDPHTLAHELTHVLQQRAGQVTGVDNGSGLSVSEPTDRFERAAEANAHRVMSEPSPVQRADPHQHVATSAEPIVQRRVGFEFEAQWNVRNIADRAGAEQRYQQAVADRDRTIKVALLNQMIGSLSASVRDPRVTDEERDKGAASLRQDWLDAAGPTEDGEAKLKSQHLEPGTMQWEGAVHTLMFRSQVTEAPLLGDNPRKGEVLVAGDKFDLTADVSPTGGADLEWVTAPLESEREVEQVVGNIVKMARYLNSRRTERAIPVGDVRAGGGTPRPNLVIYPIGRELLFQPQVTGGIRIDSLADLVGFLNEPAPSQGSTAATEIFTEGVQPLFDSLGPAREAVRADENLRPYERELVGLLGLIGSYLRTANTLDRGANPKSIAGGMLARTDFAHNFGLLPTGARDYLRGTPDVFVRLAMDSAGMSLTDAANRLYPNTIERGEVGDRTPVTFPLTRRQWLEGMLNGNDYLKNWDLLAPQAQATVAANQQEWQAMHPSLGGLGTVTDQVPMSPRGFKANAVAAGRRVIGERAPDQVTALVVELRRMRGDRRVDDLKRLAVVTFDLFERLNLGRRLKFSR